jgi:IS5 family transposase
VDRELLDAGGLCGHLLGEDSLEAFLARYRRELFPDGMFADLFGSGRGRPSIEGSVIATVMVLQAAEHLSDRRACQRLQTDIAWKAATGLSLTDEAFHPTVLVLWRNRLRASEDPERIFNAVRHLADASGVLAGRTRRVLDSTVLDDAVARQDTIKMLVAQIRRVRRLIPELVGVWVREDNLEGSKPPANWDDPADIDRLVSELVDDALELIAAAEDLDLTEVQADAIGLLGLIIGQDVEPGDGLGQWRTTKGTAPDRIVSTVDPESRHTHKTSHSYRDGYKAHVAVEPDTGLITAQDLTPGNVGDAEAAGDLLTGEPAGTEVLGDSAYGSGDLRAELADREMTAAIKPPPLKPAVPGGFSLDDFDVDTDAGTVTCPAGHVVALTPSRTARFGIRCAGCPLRARCTKAKSGRVIKLHVHHALLAAARALATTDAFQHTYRNKRPMVERSIAWLVRNARRLPYIGVERNQLWLANRCAAINLKRLINLGLNHSPTGWAI